MKTVLITGCNRGLGKELIKSFAKNGYCIISINRRQYEDYDILCDSLKESYGVSIYQFYADLSDEVSIKNTLDKIEDLNISIDVLINNAGIHQSAKPIFYQEYADVLLTMKINYLAPFQICKRVASLMVRENKGSIINITSVVSLITEPGGYSYDASKSALNILTKSLAMELGPFGIRVNGVACGIMNTNMFNNLDDKIKKKNLKRVSKGIPVELNDVAKLIQFLASDDATSITGDIIRIDNGFN